LHRFLRAHSPPFSLVKGPLGVPLPGGSQAPENFSQGTLLGLQTVIEKNFLLSS
jgi:hypothetical protein